MIFVVHRGIEPEEIEALNTLRISNSNHYYDIPKGSLVFQRYCTLPFPQWNIEEIELHGSKPVNSLKNHQLAANFYNWYEILQNYTPLSWSRVEDIPQDCNGPFVVKGETNSLKHKWNTHMYAPSRKELGTVLANAFSDTLLATQRPVIRLYEKLEKLEDSVAGYDISNEHRVFCLNGVVMASGFYWSQITDKTPSEYPPVELCDKIARLLGVGFYAFDVAKTIDGRWILIEVNDGNMSGLSCVNPVDLWTNISWLL